MVLLVGTLVTVVAVVVVVVLSAVVVGVGVVLLFLFGVLGAQEKVTVKRVGSETVTVPACRRGWGMMC